MDTWQSNERPKPTGLSARDMAELSRFKQSIGYEGLSPEEKSYADQQINSIPWSQYNAGWDNEYVGKFQQGLSQFRLEQDTKKARGRFDELTNANSGYNQNIYNRISRMFSPKGDTNSLLLNALGLGEKSSAFIAKGLMDQESGKARENTYNAFQQSFEENEGRALGYLDLASGKESFLTKLMSDQNLSLAQMSEDRRRYESEERNSLYNTLLKGGIGAGTALLTGGASLLPTIAAAGFDATGKKYSRPNTSLSYKPLSLYP